MSKETKHKTADILTILTVITLLLILGGVYLVMHFK